MLGILAVQCFVFYPFSTICFRRSILLLAVEWCLFLFQPFNATRINASAINNRVNELEKENGNHGTGKAGFWEEFEVRSFWESVWREVWEEREGGKLLLKSWEEFELSSFLKMLGEVWEDFKLSSCLESTWKSLGRG